MFSLTGRLCSGEVYILTEQTMWFLPPASCWEVVTRILIFWGYCFWSAWLMIFLSDARAFSLTSFDTWSSSLRLNKGFRLFNFLKSPSLIWITESDFLLSVNVMVSYNEFCHAGPSSLVFLRDVKFSWIVIHRSKFLRMYCSLNWSYFKHGELRCESVKIALKQWFLNYSLFF